MPGARGGCYLLPCAPDIRCDDRFDLTNTEDDKVAYWSIVQVLLKREIHDAAQLIDLLDTVAVTLRGSSLSDYDVLQEHLSSFPGHFFSDFWPALARLALDQPMLFPGGRLPVLDQFDSSHRAFPTTSGMLDRIPIPVHPQGTSRPRRPLRLLRILSLVLVSAATSSSR